MTRFLRLLLFAAILLLGWIVVQMARKEGVLPEHGPSAQDPIEPIGGPHLAPASGHRPATPTPPGPDAGRDGQLRAEIIVSDGEGGIVAGATVHAARVLSAPEAVWMAVTDERGIAGLSPLAMPELCEVRVSAAGFADDTFQLVLGPGARTVVTARRGCLISVRLLWQDGLAGELLYRVEKPGPGSVTRTSELRRGRSLLGRFAGGRLQLMANSTVPWASSIRPVALPTTGDREILITPPTAMGPTLRILEWPSDASSGQIRVWDARTGSRVGVTESFGPSERPLTLALAIRNGNDVDFPRPYVAAGWNPSSSFVERFVVPGRSNYAEIEPRTDPGVTVTLRVPTNSAIVSARAFILDVGSAPSLSLTHERSAAHDAVFIGDSASFPGEGCEWAGAKQIHDGDVNWQGVPRPSTLLFDVESAMGDVFRSTVRIGARDRDVQVGMEMVNGVRITVGSGASVPKGEAVWIVVRGEDGEIVGGPVGIRARDIRLIGLREKESYTITASTNTLSGQCNCVARPGSALYLEMRPVALLPAEVCVVSSGHPVSGIVVAFRAMDDSRGPILATTNGDGMASALIDPTIRWVVTTVSGAARSRRLRAQAGARVVLNVSPITVIGVRWRRPAVTGRVRILREGAEIRAEDVTLIPDGELVLGSFEPGQYTVDIQSLGVPPKPLFQQPVHVQSREDVVHSAELWILAD